MMPTNEILSAMHQANMDGCGFCTPTKSYKGLSFATFMKKIKGVQQDEPCIMHFRFATHGSVKSSNCHPFYDDDTNTWFAHNGILDVMPEGDTTDSETAFRDIIVPNIKAYGLHARYTKYIIEHLAGCSRFAFMQGDDVVMFGSYSLVDGCYFSNLRFMHYVREARIYRHNTITGRC